MWWYPPRGYRQIYAIGLRWDPGMPGILTRLNRTVGGVSDYCGWYHRSSAAMAFLVHNIPSSTELPYGIVWKEYQGIGI